MAGIHWCKEIIESNNGEYAEQASISTDISGRWTLFIDGIGGISSTKIKYCAFCGLNLKDTPTP